jgi:hypothetical protein
MPSSTCRAAALAALVLLTGCATNTVELSDAAPATRFCERVVRPGATVVLWGPHWRPDQKDAPLREAAAAQGLSEYVANSACLRGSEIHRWTSERPPSAEQMKQLALAAAPQAQIVIAIAVRELGPFVRLLSSAALVEGGTEVVLDVSYFNVTDSTASTQFTIRRRSGGPGVVKGVATLPQDMRAALAAALEPGGLSESR